MTMKCFADLKRAIQPGTRMEVIAHDYRPELIGSKRTVTRVQTNGYYFTTDVDPRECWSAYGKAAQFSFPAPDTYRFDGGAQPNGRTFAWTVRIIPQEVTV